MMGTWKAFRSASQLGEMPTWPGLAARRAARSPTPGSEHSSPRLYRRRFRSRAAHC